MPITPARSGTLVARATLALLTALTVVLTVTPAPASAAQVATVERWIDGDTVITSRGTIRLIGIDTPEVGTCGAKKATRLARRLAPVGSTIRLGNPSSVQNTDTYDRKLRYVLVSGVDVGLRQIRQGAKARYDGRDGYDKHPRQRKYRRADKKNADFCAKKGTKGADTKAYAPLANSWNCPKKAPIKGNRGDEEWIYHRPNQEYYDATNPEECFATAAGAEKHGYRAARI